MTQDELFHVEKRLEKLFAHHVDEFAKSFVSKADFVNLVAKVENHEKAYQDYLQLNKWIKRLGIATVISSIISPHLAWIFKILKTLFP